MAEKTDGSAFARDLGYLDKFFVNIRSFADTIPEAEGQRLRQLMDEETARWAEIRQLLGAGGSSAPASAPAESQKPVEPVPPPPAKLPASQVRPAPVPRPAAKEVVPPPPPPTPKPRPAFTVGNLYGQPKK